MDAQQRKMPELIELSNSLCREIDEAENLVITLENRVSRFREFRQPENCGGNTSKSETPSDYLSVFSMHLNRFNQVNQRLVRLNEALENYIGE
jgi:hypothetical protein